MVSGSYRWDAAPSSKARLAPRPLLPWSYPSTREHGKTSKIEGAACWQHGGNTKIESGGDAAAGEERAVLHPEDGAARGHGERGGVRRRQVIAQQ